MMKFSITAIAIAFVVSGCTSSRMTSQPAPTAPDPARSKRILRDGGQLVLPDGTRVTPDASGSFALPNGDQVRRDRGGALVLRTGARCLPDRGGYTCP